MMGPRGGKRVTLSQLPLAAFFLKSFLNKPLFFPVKERHERSLLDDVPLYEFLTRKDTTVVVAPHL